MIIGGYYQLTHKDDSLEKMMNWHDITEIIPQSRPSFDKKEAEACYNYIMEDNFITEYNKTLELEKIISNYICCKHVIMTTSGTNAIILALLSLNLKKGSEVIVPNFTMIATINSVKFLGLVPKIIDVDRYTYTLNLENIKKNITDKTKVIIHVSINNRYSNFRISSFCQKNIFLIEDSAQSLGCKTKEDKFLGTYGICGCFSLSTPKIISTGQRRFCYYR